MKKQEAKSLIKNHPKKVALVIDYDRTLVNGQKKLMATTKKTLINFQRKGGIIIIASGRPLSGLEMVCDELKLKDYNGYVIATNGAKVHRLSDNCLLHVDNISIEKLNVALQKLESLPLKRGIYTEQILCVNRSNDDLKDEARSNQLEFKVCNLFNNLNESTKIILADTRATTHNYYADVCSLLEDDFNVVKSSPRYIEITNKNVNKGNGIQKILSCPQNDIKYLIGFGDSQNDYEMLKMCDIKIAMANATADIKMISDFVIGSNEADGIGEFLKNK